jgi:hypothetical protein
MSIQPNENDLTYLEYCYENWENIELIVLEGLNSMSLYYQLVIKTPDDKFFQTYANGDDEGPTEDFQDLEWEQVVLKEVTVQQWVPL